MAESLKTATARTLKWNTVDRLSSQVLYAVTGIILANLISPEDFGLAGAILVFQAFAALFVDSGFGSALLQKKNADESDYSTIFWFNLAVSAAVYWILFFCAPLIADIFQGDRRLIPLSRVMFLTFIFNGLGLVQTNQLMKKMDVKQIAVANIVGLTISGGLGAGLAFGGFGPWALVWQSVTLAAVKSAWLWSTGHWRPRAPFSVARFKSMWRLAFSVFSTSGLSIFFLHIYSFVIGAFYSLTALGIYTQADKWSKMGSASISQVITASFVPVLSRYQDDMDRYRGCMRRINRFCGFIVFPAMSGMAMMGEPLFHALFGNKWDAAIILFQILTLRGIFVVLTALLSNYMLALGNGRRLFSVEVIKDVLTAAALLSTVWFDSLTWLVVGQFAATFITWWIALRIVSVSTGYRGWRIITDNLPYAGATVAACAAVWLIPATGINPWLQLLAILALGAGIYTGILGICRVPELPEAFSYISRRKQKPARSTR